MDAAVCACQRQGHPVGDFKPQRCHFGYHGDTVNEHMHRKIAANHSVSVLKVHGGDLYLQTTLAVSLLTPPSSWFPHSLLLFFLLTVFSSVSQSVSPFFLLTPPSQQFFTCHSGLMSSNKKKKKKAHLYLAIQWYYIKFIFHCEIFVLFVIMG